MSSNAREHATPLDTSRDEGLKALEAGFDYPGLTPTTFRYAIFSQQRTGSNWLCARLTNLHAFGVPHEYLNPLLARSLGPRLGASARPLETDLEDYLRRVEAVRTAESGRFGIKIQPDQLLPLMRHDLDAARRFLRRYDAVIVLHRRDKLAQAISGTIAEATSIWRNDGREPEVSEAQMRLMVGRTARYLGKYVSEETTMEAVLQGMGRPRLDIDFERIVAEPEAALRRAVAFLGGGDAAQPMREEARMGTPERPPGRVAAELRARFLRFLEDGSVGAAPRAQ